VLLLLNSFKIDYLLALFGNHVGVMNVTIVFSQQLLESKIQEAKSNKDTLKARAQSAKFVLSSPLIL